MLILFDNGLIGYMTPIRNYFRPTWFDTVITRHGKAKIGRFDIKLRHTLLFSRQMVVSEWVSCIDQDRIANDKRYYMTTNLSGSRKLCTTAMNAYKETVKAFKPLSMLVLRRTCV